MFRRVCIKQFLFASILFVFLFSSEKADAVFIRSIWVEPLKNPVNWKGTYSPGTLVTALIKEKVDKSPYLIWVPQKNRGSSSSDSGFEDRQLLLDSTSETEEIGEQAQFSVSGKILQFTPKVSVSDETSHKNISEDIIAEVQIELEVINNLTGKVYAKEVLWSVGDGGGLLFGVSPTTLNIHHQDFVQTSMGRALIDIADKSVRFFISIFDRLPLDSMIVSLDKKNDKVLLNVGAKDGVSIRDEFIIFRFDSDFKDPKSSVTIGTRLMRMGVVRIKSIEESISEAMIVAGGDFEVGQLARSRINESSIDWKQVSKNKSVRLPIRNKNTERDFRIERRPRERPKTLLDVDLFSVLGFGIKY